LPSIVIRLDPARLQNPDLDLRYEIPDRLAVATGGLVDGDGYDYEEGGALQIYLDTADLELAVPRVVAFLENESLHGNHLAAAAQVGVSDSAASALEFRLVYPAGVEGVIVPPIPPAWGQRPQVS
jgi:hypothetical protein